MAHWIKVVDYRRMDASATPTLVICAAIVKQILGELPEVN
jgi:hypothetical protein